MSTEIEKLKQAFDTEGHPLPLEASREAAIAHAMQAFAKENPSQVQGSTEQDRLTDTRTKVSKSLFRRRSMKLHLPNLKPMMIGGATLAVLSLAILNTQNVQQKRPFSTEVDAQNTRLAASPSPGYEREPAPTAPTGGLNRGGDYDAFSGLNNEVAGAAVVAEPGAGRGVQIQASKAPNRNVAPLGDHSPVITASDRERNKTISSDAMTGKPTRAEKRNAERHNSTRQRSEFKREKEALIARAQRPAIAKDKATTSSYAYGAPPMPAATAAEMPLSLAEPNVAGGITAFNDATGDQGYKVQGRDRFSDITPNPLKLVSEEPVSTFSIDVDTASYAFMRASLNNNVLPQKDAIRIEELINYFPYEYAAPQDKSEPFRAHVNVMPTPWNPATKLMHIGIKGYELPQSDKPHSNLVFLIDSSGSMNAPNKLPLLRNSFKLLLSTLRPDDTIAIVTYAGSAGTVLEPTPVADKNRIIAALDRLRSGGSTAGAEGIRQAYQLAEQNFDQSGVNRVILATDGDFNVGITDHEELKSYIERKRNTGVFLSVLGFGQGNYNDELMQTLAQSGNGNAAYIDSLTEARKVLVEEAGSTLFTIAKDVKIQIEFNPQTVSEYRLIGYETRLLNREDFNNDKIDAGDIGAGHTVTAIYEITAMGSAAQLVDDLRYQSPTKSTTTAQAQEYAFLKLRYKLPESDSSTLITTPVTRASEVSDIAAAPREAKHATAVAALGQLLRGGRFTGGYSYDDVIELALGAKGDDRLGYRAEFINLVRLAKSAAAMESLQR